MKLYERRTQSASPDTDVEILPRDDYTDPKRQIRALAQLLDSAFEIPGTRIRIGLDSIIGVVPVIGDALGALISSYIVVVAARAGAPRWVLIKMVGNIAIEAFFGAVPILGDLFDVVWRSNMRNAHLFEQATLTPLSTAQGEARLREVLALLVSLGVLLIVILAAVGLWTMMKLTTLMFG